MLELLVVLTLVLAPVKLLTLRSVRRTRGLNDAFDRARLRSGLQGRAFRSY